jgi:hypothetical protein
MDQSLDASLINDIADDVLRVLSQIRLFERLDDLYCPTGTEVLPVKCRHDYAQTELILTEGEMDEQEVKEVVAVLDASGGHCDCEVLYNLAETSRFKSLYWQTRSKSS